jgi:hypothetical protein
VEDISVLIFLIHDHEMKQKPLRKITKIWQDIRKPRVERISSFANWKTKWFSGELAAFTKKGHWGDSGTSPKEFMTPNFRSPGNND